MAGLLTLYETLIRAGKPALEMLLRARARRGKEDSLRINERKGRASIKRPAGKIVWVHAASVGEAQSALILINAMDNAAPDTHIVVTTGTVTSATLMERRLPANAFHQYVPLDHPVWVKSFLDHWQPDLALWMESELWPNMLGALKRRNIPAILVNARLSENSFRNWSMAKGAASKILGTFDLILAQTKADAHRFESLGAKNVTAGDNLKYGAAPLPYDELSLSALSLTVDGRPVWVYASTHEGEEDLACRVHARLKETIPSLLTIIVPRHPERREDVAKSCFENS
ncbi:MAG: 3-deoxy-D-manno-octulosonic acid transferase, partial [Micavibrio aeruginosavorus]